MSLESRTTLRRSLPGLAIEGVPFIAAGLGLTAATSIFSRRAALAPLALTAFTTYFFRDPDRRLDPEPHGLYSPADGHVTLIDEIDEPRFIGGPATRIATFLSVFDVHINRIPFGGTVAYRDYVEGEFRAAWDKEADSANERAYIGLETPYGRVLLVQIAGLVARRIITWPTVGEELATGERYGLIRFGSRTDLIVPRDTMRVLVTKGQKIVGAQTKVGEWVV